jgi:hypothetical protein
VSILGVSGTVEQSRILVHLQAGSINVFSLLTPLFELAASGGSAVEHSFRTPLSDQFCNARRISVAIILFTEMGHCHAA